jgi:hypothetical protein
MLQMLEPAFWPLSFLPSITDDIRFDNEAQLIRDLGGQIVHLRRDYVGGTDKVDHRSEKGTEYAFGDVTIHSGKKTAEEGTYDLICAVLGIGEEEKCEPSDMTQELKGQ